MSKKRSRTYQCGGQKCKEISRGGKQQKKANPVHQCRPPKALAMWSCMAYNESDSSSEHRLCQDFGLILSVFSLFYLMVCFPVGLCYNALLVVVNLSNKVSMTMPDVYFVNMAVAGLVLNLVAPVELLGPSFTRWPVWEYNNEVYITLLILFNISSLVIMYSTTLLSLDYYIERALPRTYMSSVYNTKHVCGFIWGGAVLTSFSSLLFYVCNHVSTKIMECSKMQNKEAADAIMMFIGYVVPAVAVSYALVLILRIRKESTPLDHESARLDPSVHRLLLASVCMQFVLWTPYYMTLLVHTIAGAPGGYSNNGTQRQTIYFFLRCLSELLGFSSSFAMPLMYRQMNTNFSHKLQRLLKRLHCRDTSCTHERTAGQQVVT
uniref:G protein-coupled receptor 146 n=2 Tax=Esox lucius TaxID=8010 RepID=A0AAY5KCD5_ESOLU